MHLFNSGRRLLANRRGDAHVVIRKVKVVSIGILYAALESWLIGEPDKEATERRQCVMNRCPAQLFARPCARLSIEPALERHRLLTMEFGKVAVVGAFFKPAEGLGNPIDRGLASAAGRCTPGTGSKARVGVALNR